MQKVFFTFSFLLLTGTAAVAQDNLYVYTAGGARQTFSLSQEPKITFDTTNMFVAPTSGTATTIPLDAVEVITFAPRGGETSIKTVRQSDLKVWQSAANALSVESSETVKQISIYGVQGNLVRQAIPNALAVNVSLAGVSAGVYIVRVATASGLQSKKIIINHINKF
jgi:hypothetical protein